jgi:hypothetical protein
MPGPYGKNFSPEVHHAARYLDRNCGRIFHRRLGTDRFCRNGNVRSFCRHVPGWCDYRTIYVQGNKQKVEKPRVDSITDLDKGVVYIVDKRHKEYLEIPITDSRLDQRGQRDSQSESILLDKTPDTCLVANQTCSEYRGAHTNENERIAVSACVSLNAPGTSEVVAFDEKLSRAVGVQGQVPRKGLENPPAWCSKSGRW